MSNTAGDQPTPNADGDPGALSRAENWCKHVVRAGSHFEWAGGAPDPWQHREHVEPWLSALFQAEHLNLLVGSGLKATTSSTWTSPARPERDSGLVFRQNRINGLDFSVILAVLVAQSTQVFRLRRYNGRSHEHTNQIEHETFYDFHIHLATERYQERGAREDAYARPTDRYGTFRGALDCLFTDANFSVPSRAQGNLFDPVEEV